MRSAALKASPANQPLAPSSRSHQSICSLICGPMKPCSAAAMIRFTSGLRSTGERCGMTLNTSAITSGGMAEPSA